MSHPLASVDDAEYVNRTYWEWLVAAMRRNVMLLAEVQELRQANLALLASCCHSPPAAHSVAKEPES